MFIIWGTKSRQRYIGKTEAELACSHCGMRTTMKAQEVIQQFTFFWIPLFKMSSVYYLFCPNCFCEEEVSQLMLNRYLKNL